MTRPLRVGTRRSLLARTQTDHVLQLLRASHPRLDIMVQTVSTLGDQTVGPLPASKPGVFTGALETALLNQTIDFAVHSMKDLPIDRPQELVIAAITHRTTAFEMVVTLSGQTIFQLPMAATIGTSSLRRKAQLQAIRPDFVVTPMRGNIDTRVQEVLDRRIHAVVLAEAGLQRLEIPRKYIQRIPMRYMLPAPAQGALAVECRKDDPDMIRILASINCPATWAATAAERAFLKTAGGGCSIPISAYAETKNKEIHLLGEVRSPNGSRQISLSGSGEDAVVLGCQLGEKANHLGARELLQHG